MTLIKGFVLMSRFDYLEKNAGKDAIKKFLTRIKLELEDYARQPVIGSNNYPQSSIEKIDKILLEDYFSNNLEEFRQLGNWYADHFMNHYFSMYLEEQSPIEFIYQYARLRPFILGTGNMSVTALNNKSLSIKIEYQQNIPRSVCISEQGFLVRALELCGLNQIDIREDSCAVNDDNYICKYQLTYKKSYE